MNDQEIKELKYVHHAIRNGTTRIEGLLREIENTVAAMGVAVRSYRESNSYDESDKENKA